MCLDEPQHHVQELLNATLGRISPWGGQSPHPPNAGSPGRDTCCGTCARTMFPEARGRGGGRIRHRRSSPRQNHCRKLAKGQQPSFPAAENRQEQPQLTCYPADGANSDRVGIRTCSRHDERRFALRLLNTLLGENMSCACSRSSGKTAGWPIPFTARRRSFRTQVTWSFPPAWIRTICGKRSADPGRVAADAGNRPDPGRSPARADYVMARWNSARKAPKTK